MSKLFQIDRKHRTINIKLIGILILICTLFVFNSSCFANSGKTYFNIKPQQIRFALEKFAKQMDISIVYNLEDIDEITTKNVSGMHTINQALEIMLEDTNLIFEHVDKENIAIRKNDLPSDEKHASESDLKNSGTANQSVLPMNNDQSEQKQDVDKPEEGSGKDYVLEATIITAQKREQEIMEVPMAITAITTKDIIKRGALDLVELQASIPSLTVLKSGIMERIYIRGISSVAATMPIVGRYVDEMPINTETVATGLDFPLVDMARVEVLKGPQGTLYGEGSIGGTLRYITKGPKFGETDGTVEASVRSVKHGNLGYRAWGAANLPINSETIGVRVVGYYERAPGWVDNTFQGDDANTIDRWFGRIKAYWNPSEWFRAEMLYQHYDTTFQVFNYSLNDFTSNYFTSDESEGDYDIMSLKLLFDMGWAELVSVTSYQDRYQFMSADTSYLTAYVPHLPIENISWDKAFDVTSFTQELRMSGNMRDTLFWTAGVYYRDSETESSLETTCSPDNNLTPWPLIYGPGFTATKAMAVFGEINYLFTDKLETTFGIRRYKDDREAVMQTIVFGSTSTPSQKF